VPYTINRNLAVDLERRGIFQQWTGLILGGQLAEGKDYRDQRK